ncbi:MAG: cysteine hydrolase family protein [Bacteroidota bacterium]
MNKIIFWDVDTQIDFVMHDGKLAVPEAEEIISNLARLTDFARAKGIPLLGSVDYHSLDDPEISSNPDFRETYPPHCLKGTPGQAKIPATAPRNPLWIESQSYDMKELQAMVSSHTGEIIFRKQRFDVFSNPNVDAVLSVIDPKVIVVYGVALDVCDAYAIEGFLQRGKYSVYLVEDATKPIRKDEGEALKRSWAERGVTIVQTSDVVEKNVLGVPT